jgi:hypothetical protein
MTDVPPVIPAPAPSGGVKPKFGIWLNALFIVLSALASGAVLYGVPAPITTVIKAYASDGALLIATANMLFHLFASNDAGPGVVIFSKIRRMLKWRGSS